MSHELKMVVVEIDNDPFAKHGHEIRCEGGEDQSEEIDALKKENEDLKRVIKEQSNHLSTLQRRISNIRQAANGRPTEAVPYQ